MRKLARASVTNGHQRLRTTRSCDDPRRLCGLHDSASAQCSHNHLKDKAKGERSLLGSTVSKDATDREAKLSCDTVTNMHANPWIDSIVKSKAQEDRAEHFWFVGSRSATKSGSRERVEFRGGKIPGCKVNA